MSTDTPNTTESHQDISKLPASAKSDYYQLWHRQEITIEDLMYYFASDDTTVLDMLMEGKDIYDSASE